jgi:hypothetical protein
MDNNVDFKKEAISLIIDNLGETMGSYYEKYYQDKSDKEILLSLKELLSETVGTQNAQRQLQFLIKQ